MVKRSCDTHLAQPFLNDQDVGQSAETLFSGAAELASVDQDTVGLGSKSPTELADFFCPASAKISQLFANSTPPTNRGSELSKPHLASNENTPSTGPVSDTSNRTGGPSLAKRPALARLANAIAAAEDAERKKISSELHDFLLQDVIGIRFDIKELRHRCSEDVQALLSEMELMINNIDSCIRTISFTNFSTFDPLISLADNLKKLAIGFSNRSGVRVVLSCRADQVSQKCSEVIFRTAQEALMNVYRHSNATSATLRLTRKKSVLSLEVCDNGCADKSGTGSELVPGVGLQSVRERLQSCGGTLEVARSDQGFSLTATLPVMV